MKASILFFVILFGMNSCSDDGYPLLESEPEIQKPPLVSKLTMRRSGRNEIFRFEYDEKNRIKKIFIETPSQFTWTYIYNDDDYVVTIYDSAGPESKMDFFYNDQHILTGYKPFFDEISPITYDPETLTYNVGPSTYIMNAAADVASTTFIDYEYSGGKGIFSNVVGKNISLINHMILQLPYVCSKKAIKEINLSSNGNPAYEINTTSNNEGDPLELHFIGKLPNYTDIFFDIEY